MSIWVAWLERLRPRALASEVMTLEDSACPSSDKDAGVLAVVVAVRVVSAPSVTLLAKWVRGSPFIDMAP